MLLPYVGQGGRFRSSAAMTVLKHSLEVALKSCGDDLPWMLPVSTLGTHFSSWFGKGRSKEANIHEEGVLNAGKDYLL